MFNIKIPDELSFHSILPEDVNILVGENGCGKSYLLGQLAEVYLNGSYSNVIGIANSIHDKFNSRGHRFHPLRARQGRRQTKEILKRTFINISKDEKRLSYISRALEYVNYKPVIGFKLSFKEKIDFEYKIENSPLSLTDKEKVISLLRKYKSLQENKNLQEKAIVWLKMEKYDFGELERYSTIDIFKWESILCKLGVMNPIELFLSKDNISIPLLDASSGELSLITSLIYISSVIDDNTVILVDEPENSLHPKWQREYVKTMMDIFYRYQPRLVIATHSPLIISGSVVSINKTKVYKGYKFEFSLQYVDPSNIEEIFYDFFDTTTPQNRFLSQLLVKNLNLLSEKKIDLGEFHSIISDIKNSTNDNRQLNILVGINKIAQKIVNKIPQ